MSVVIGISREVNTSWQWPWDDQVQRHLRNYTVQHREPDGQFGLPKRMSEAWEILCLLAESGAKREASDQWQASGGPLGAN